MSASSKHWSKVYTIQIHEITSHCTPLKQGNWKGDLIIAACFNN
uniref:Uncharacterized protein n=1 Tax=Arundo donax TaxID=35708 RepID=A0A0A8ZZU9_ARUDO